MRLGSTSFEREQSHTILDGCVVRYVQSALSPSNPFTISASRNGVILSGYAVVTEPEHVEEIDYVLHCAFLQSDHLMHHSKPKEEPEMSAVTAPNVKVSQQTADLIRSIAAAYEEDGEAIPVHIREAMAEQLGVGERYIRKIVNGERR